MDRSSVPLGLYNVPTIAFDHTTTSANPQIPLRDIQYEHQPSIHGPQTPTANEQTAGRSAIASNSEQLPSRLRVVDVNNEANTSIPEAYQGAGPPPEDMNTNDNMQMRPWAAVFRQLVSLRSTVLVSRMEVKKRRTVCQQQRQSCHSLIEQLLTTLSTCLEEGTLPSKDDMDQLSMRLRVQLKDLNISADRTIEVEDDLSNMEYQMSKVESTIYPETAAEDLYTVDPNFPSPEGQEHDPEEVTEETSHPFLEELYDKMGDLKILRDRLREFEHEVRRELKERIRLRQLDESLRNTDTEFFEAQSVARARMQEEYVKARADVDRLKQACSAEELVFEDFEGSNDLLPFEMPDSKKRPPLSSPPEDSSFGYPSSGSESLIDGFMRGQSRVTDWIGLPSARIEVTEDADVTKELTLQAEDIDSNWEELETVQDGNNAFVCLDHPPESFGPEGTSASTPRTCKSERRRRRPSCSALLSSNGTPTRSSRPPDATSRPCRSVSLP